MGHNRILPVPFWWICRLFSFFFFACSNNAAINNLLYTSFGKRTNISKGGYIYRDKAVGSKDSCIFKHDSYCQIAFCGGRSNLPAQHKWAGVAVPTHSHLARKHVMHSESFWSLTNEESKWYFIMLLVWGSLLTNVHLLICLKITYTSLSIIWVFMFLSIFSISLLFSLLLICRRILYTRESSFVNYKLQFAIVYFCLTEKLIFI